MPKTHPKRGDLRMGEYYVAGLPCSDELYHYGILKQKWGVRRFQNSDGSLTAAGRERYGVGKVRTKLNSVKQKASKAAKSTAAYIKERNKMKHPSLMTDDELRNYTQRLIAEKNYSDALARAQSATGFGRAEKFVSDIVTAVPKAAARGVAAIPQDVVDIAKRGVNTIADAGFQRIANQVRKTNSERKLEKLRRERDIQNLQEEMDDADGSQAQRKELEKLQRESQISNLRNQLDTTNVEMQRQINMLNQQKQLKDLQKALDPSKNGGGLAAAMQILNDPNASASQIKDAKVVLEDYNRARSAVDNMLNPKKGKGQNQNLQDNFVASDAYNRIFTGPASLSGTFRPAPTPEPSPIQNANPTPAPQPTPAPASQPIQNTNPTPAPASNDRWFPSRYGQHTYNSQFQSPSIEEQAAWQRRQEEMARRQQEAIANAPDMDEYYWLNRRY